MAPESIQEFLILIPPRWDGSSNSTHQVAAAFCYTNSLQPCPVESLNLSGSQLWPASPDLQWFVIVGFRETHLHSIPVYDTFCVVLMSLQSPTSRIGSFPPSTAGAFLGGHSDTSPTSVLLGNTRVVPCIFMPTIALGNVGKCGNVHETKCQTGKRRGSLRAFSFPSAWVY